jgi:hypothetical protein
MPPGKLSVVPPGAKPTRKRPATIKAATELCERDLLVAMRVKVASEIDGGVPAHALAPLMRQLRELDKEIRMLDAREEQEAKQDASHEDGSFDASAV